MSKMALGCLHGRMGWIRHGMVFWRVKVGVWTGALMVGVGGISSRDMCRVALVNKLSYRQ